MSLRACLRVDGEILDASNAAVGVVVAEAPDRPALEAPDQAAQSSAVGGSPNATQMKAGASVLRMAAALAHGAIACDAPVRMVVIYAPVLAVEPDHAADTWGPVVDDEPAAGGPPASSAGLGHVVQRGLPGMTASAPASWASIAAQAGHVPDQEGP